MSGEIEFCSDQLLESLMLPPRVAGALKKAGLVYVSHVLSHSRGDLIRKTELSQRDVVRVVAIASKTLAIQPSNALELLHAQSVLPNEDMLTTGCPLIDSLLRGGFLAQGVTEISGESAAGKTQICLQLSLMVQLPTRKGGLNGGAVYVCTEDAFPTKRLTQLSEAFVERYKDLGFSAKHCSDNIFVEHAATISTLSVLLQFKLPLLLSQKNIKLVVVDSLAALFRVEFSLSQMWQRAQLLYSFGANLHHLAEKFNAAVVCVNQVTSEVGVGNKPSLGLAWANVITTRLVVHRDEAVKQDTCRQLRRLCVAFAPHLPLGSVQYCISCDGVHGVEPTFMNMQHK